MEKGFCCWCKHSYGEKSVRNSRWHVNTWFYISANIVSSPTAFLHFYFHLCRYEAGLLFAYLAFIPFCEAGIMDSLSLQVWIVPNYKGFRNVFYMEMLSVSYSTKEGLPSTLLLMFFYGLAEASREHISTWSSSYKRVRILSSFQ